MFKFVIKRTCKPICARRAQLSCSPTAQLGLKTLFINLENTWDIFFAQH